jgi:hypothetical protein
MTSPLVILTRDDAPDILHLCRADNLTSPERSFSREQDGVAYAYALVFADIARVEQRAPRSLRKVDSAKIGAVT